MNTLRAFFFINLVLTGFFSSIGFVNAVGLVPAMEDTPVQHLVPYWQLLDFCMRSRMPILGVAMLLSFAFLLVGLARQKPANRLAFWLAATSVLMVFSDLFITFTQNLPINLLLKKLDPEKVPASFELQKVKAARAFYLWSIPMMLSSVLMILSYFRFEATHALSAGIPDERTLTTQ